MKPIEEITQIAQPILDRYNAELIDIGISGSRHRPILRMLVDKEGGITLGECSDINRQLSEILDKDDAIKESFILEVSSPGLDRPLKKKKDFEKVIGKKINLYTKEYVEGKNFFCAVLDSVDEKSISLVTKDGQILKVPYENINKANLEIKF